MAENHTTVTEAASLVRGVLAADIPDRRAIARDITRALLKGQNEALWARLRKSQRDG